MSQIKFKNPFVSTPPSLIGSGNGTLTVDRLTHFTITQDYEAICTAIAPFVVFNIVGSLDGSAGVAIVGDQFTDADLKIFLTINQGPIPFDVGDKFSFSVTQGTDVTEENFNEYDENPQKNFGTGILGLHAGNENVRLNALAAFSKALIQDILYTSKLIEGAGNAISVDYENTSTLQKASLTIQDLFFEADTAGTLGNNITMEYEDWFSGQNASATKQDIIWYAQDVGVAGNNITIAYTGGGTKGSEIVTLVGDDVSIQIEDGVSTVTDIRDAVKAHVGAHALVGSFANGTGLETQVIEAATSLTGGLDTIGEAGSEVVTVIGTAIKVILQSGVSTAQQVKDALDASIDAAALINVAITGTGTNQQAAPVGPLNLSGGTDAAGTPGNEIITVDGTKITIGFQSGINTANDLIAAIIADVDASALVDVTLDGVGTTPQSAPVTHTLRGGHAAKTYALNKTEITAPATFYEGNADILAKQIIAQDGILASGDSKFIKPVELDDPNSGKKIENLQSEINNLTFGNSIFIGTENNSKVRWNAPELHFTAPLVVRIQGQSIFNRVLHTLYSPITLADGESVYVTINRTANVNLTPVISSTVPTGADIIRIATRIGSSVVFYDGTILSENQASRIGAAIDLSAQIFTLFESSGKVKHSDTVIGRITWDAAFKLRPLGSNQEITVYADTIDLADDEVAYIQLDDPIVNAVKTLQKASRSNVLMNRPDVFWLFHRYGNKLNVRWGGELEAGEERHIGDTIGSAIFTYMGSSGETDSEPDYENSVTPPVANDFLIQGENLTTGIKRSEVEITEIKKFFSQLRLTEHTTNKKRVIITGSDEILNNGTVISKTLQSFLLNFLGAVIDFSTGTIYKSNEVDVLGTNFTPFTVPNGKFFWYGVGLDFDAALPDGSVTTKGKIDLATAVDDTPLLAEKPALSGEIPIGWVYVEGTTTGIDDILSANFKQLSFGQGGGGGAGAVEIYDEGILISAAVNKIDIVGDTVTASLDGPARVKIEYLGGPDVFMKSETPTGIVDGTNRIFYASANPGHKDNIYVFINGRCIEDKFSLLTNEITLDVAPALAQSVFIFYAKHLTAIFKQEIPSGLINGSNTIFDISYIPASHDDVLLFLNGRLIEKSGYTLNNNQVILSAAPALGQSLWIGYKILKTDDNNFLKPFGSLAAPLVIDPAVSIVTSINQRQLRFIKSNGGGVAMTANPKIEAGTVVGQELILRGTDDTDYVILQHGNGVSLNGTINLKSEGCLTLIWDGLNWFETSRR